MKKTIFILCVLAFANTLLAGGKSVPDEGYTRQFFKRLTVTANATTSFQITEPVSKYSFWCAAPCSYTFNTSSTAVKGSGWNQVTATTTQSLLPLEKSDNIYFWFHNGATAQTIYFQSFGK
jgi:hypothetical protein